ncbi:hypothetical protein ACFOPN_21855 [Xanthomonas hyacinthi]
MGIGLHPASVAGRVASAAPRRRASGAMPLNGAAPAMDGTAALRQAMR